jgi:protein-S-isoprenylcysteine O-methyltransferase Ste14
MNQKPGSVIPRVVVQMLLFIIIIPFLPLLISWQWDWWQAWVYALIAIFGFAISRALAARRHPDLLAERARFLQHDDAKSWDKLLSPLVGLGGGLVPLVAGFDARFDLSPTFPLAVEFLALAVFLAGYMLASYALMTNRFFSGMVRIQTERGHRVVSSGPYRWMRHPGYSGALLSYLATPFFLDSVWALLPAVLLAVVLVIRTRLEDRTLQDELEGYCEYTRRVPYRLVPGIW